MDVKVPSGSNMKNKLEKTYFMLEVTNLKCRIRSGERSGSVSQVYGSKNPDPNQSVTDPEHSVCCFFRYLPPASYLSFFVCRLSPPSEKRSFLTSTQATAHPSSSAFPRWAYLPVLLTIPCTRRVVVKSFLPFSFSHVLGSKNCLFPWYRYVMCSVR